MRKRALKTIYNLAKKNHDIVYVGSDVGAGTLQEFKTDMPRRFFMEGIAEAHVIGMAAGLAMSGKVPFVNTIATFLTRRCYDQIAIDICLGNNNVRLLANGGGLVYTDLGPTHCATDDIALMRALPNMTVIVPSDDEEVESAILASESNQGPIYIRLAREGSPRIPKDPQGFKIGKAHVLREPREMLFIATGVMVHKAMSVADKLLSEGIQAGVINVHTIKPLDHKTLAPHLESTPFIFTLEEHSVIGGLGSAVSEIIAQGTRHTNYTFKIIGIPDRFPDKYGMQDDSLDYYCLNEEGVFTFALKTFFESRIIK